MAQKDFFANLTKLIVLLALVIITISNIAYPGYMFVYTSLNEHVQKNFFSTFKNRKSMMVKMLNIKTKLIADKSKICESDNNMNYVMENEKALRISGRGNRYSMGSLFYFFKPKDLIEYIKKTNPGKTKIVWNDNLCYEFNNFEFNDKMKEVSFHQVVNYCIILLLIIVYSIIFYKMQLYNRKTDAIIFVVMNCIPLCLLLLQFSMIPFGDFNQQSTIKALEQKNINQEKVKYGLYGKDIENHLSPTGFVVTQELLRNDYITYFLGKFSFIYYFPNISEVPLNPLISYKKINNYLWIGSYKQYQRYLLKGQLLNLIVALIIVLNISVSLFYVLFKNRILVVEKEGLC